MPNVRNKKYPKGTLYLKWSNNLTTHITPITFIVVGLILTILYIVAIPSLNVVKLVLDALNAGSLNSPYGIEAIRTLHYLSFIPAILLSSIPGYGAYQNLTSENDKRSLALLMSILIVITSVVSLYILEILFGAYYQFTW
jgi:hypothetical protein